MYKLFIIEKKQFTTLKSFLWDIQGGFIRYKRGGATRSLARVVRMIVRVVRSAAGRTASAPAYPMAVDSESLLTTYMQRASARDTISKTSIHGLGGKFGFPTWLQALINLHIQ